MKREVKAGGRRIGYTLIQSTRRDVLMQALPEAGIRVYAPKGMRLRDVDEVVRANADQLLAMQADVERQLAARRSAHPVTDGSPIAVEGQLYALRLHRRTRVDGSIEGGDFHLTLPHPEDEAAVRGAIKSALSALALTRIRQRLAVYGPRLGVRPNRVTIRDQKRRWGSCSTKGNLNFNWKLIMAPPGALDYVVIHELCHLKVFNHSPAFWALVEGQMPEYAAWVKWLKAHGDELGI